MSIKKDAEELGLKVDNQWPDDMIEKAIDEKLNEGAESSKKAEPKKAKKPAKVVRNISGVRFKVYGKIIQPGGEYTPTDADLKEVKGGKRIENAIKKGYLKRG